MYGMKPDLVRFPERAIDPHFLIRCIRFVHRHTQGELVTMLLDRIFVSLSMFVNPAEYHVLASGTGLEELTELAIETGVAGVMYAGIATPFFHDIPGLLVHLVSCGGRCISLIRNIVAGHPSNYRFLQPILSESIRVRDTVSYVTLRTMLQTLNLPNQVDPFTDLFPALLHSGSVDWCLKVLPEPYTPKVFDLIEIACIQDGTYWLPMLVNQYRFPLVINNPVDGPRVQTVLLRLLARAADSENCLAAARWVLASSPPLSYPFYVVHLVKALESRDEASVRLVLEYSNGHCHWGHSSRMERNTPFGVAVRREYLLGVQILYATVPVIDHPEIQFRLLLTAILYHAHPILDWLLDILHISTYNEGTLDDDGSCYPYRINGINGFDGVVDDVVDGGANGFADGVADGVAEGIACDALELAINSGNKYAIRRIVELGHDTTREIPTSSWVADVINIARRKVATEEVARKIPDDLAALVGSYLVGERIRGVFQAI
jgi:hypothetical protein